MSPRTTTRRLAISVGWSVLLLVAAWLLFSQLRTIHEFESGGRFQAHNRIHWFRPIAFFWFERYSVLPSLVLAVLICGRHALLRNPGCVTVALALLTAFLLGVGAYTIREHLSVTHQFVL